MVAEIFFFLPLLGGVFSFKFKFFDNSTVGELDTSTNFRKILVNTWIGTNIFA